MREETVQPPEIGIDGLSMFSVFSWIVTKTIDEFLQGGNFIDGILFRPADRHGSLGVARSATNERTIRRCPPRCLLN